MPSPSVPERVPSPETVSQRTAASLRDGGERPDESAPASISKEDRDEPQTLPEGGARAPVPERNRPLRNDPETSKEARDRPDLVPGHGIPAWVGALAVRAHRQDGQPPFSDQSLVELADGKRELVAIGQDAAAIFLPVTGTGTAEAEFVVDPSARRRGLGADLLATLLRRTQGNLIVWAHGDHPGARALAERYEFTPVRTLLQLRATAPEQGGSLRDSPAAPPQVPTSRERTPNTTIAAFRPGTDDAEWLALNAAAFVSHPEQGKLTQLDLDARMSEPWFDANDFLLLRGDDSALVGFCWLKVEDGLGEFYAVGVAPDRQGEGLGHVLVAAGMQRLAERGIREAALYVESDNEPAVRLYRSFGFGDYAIDVQYAHHN